MSMKNDFSSGDKLILFNSKIGYVRAVAMETKAAFEGLAYFRVGVNAEALPGVSEMVINVNSWDVYPEDDPKVLKDILNMAVPYHLTR